MKARFVLPWAIFQLHCASDAAIGTGTPGGGGAPPGLGGGSAGSPSNAGAVGIAGGSGSSSGAGFNPQVGAAQAGAASGGGGVMAVAGSGGTSSGGVPNDGSDPEVPSGYVPALVGVGYGGLRVSSRDGGKTWGDRSSFSVNGGDDENLLRAVVYGKGLWLATGWKLVTSGDGKTWTDHGMINDGNYLPCNVVEGLAYAAGWFYAACSFEPARVYRSSDGLDWTEYGTIGSTEGHLFLTHRGGKFVAFGDNDVSFESGDGLTFTELLGISSATYCANTWKSQADCFDASWFDGAYLRADWQGKISRSENGSNWSTVYTDDQQNTLYQSRAIAAGYMAP